MPYSLDDVTQAPSFRRRLTSTIAAKEVNISEITGAIYRPVQTGVARLSYVSV